MPVSGGFDVQFIEQAPVSSAGLDLEIELSMRINARGGQTAVKLCLTGVGLLIVGLALPSTGLFGDANSIGIAMFLGLFFGMPAMICVLLALLSLVARPPRPTPVASNQYLKHGEIAGACPNCEATIPVASLSCPNCSAIFGEHSSWKVQEHVRRNPSTHA